jgi:hypothetical protein
MSGSIYNEHDLSAQIRMNSSCEFHPTIKKQIITDENNTNNLFADCS